MQLVQRSFLDVWTLSHGDKWEQAGVKKEADQTCNRQ
jgi:hypothetical protein